MKGKNMVRNSITGDVLICNFSRSHFLTIKTFNITQIMTCGEIDIFLLHVGYNHLFKWVCSIISLKPVSIIFLGTNFRISFALVISE